MIAILSPAKSLDFETAAKYDLTSQPIFLDKAEYLVKKLSKMSQKKLKELMHLSDSLAELNVDRYNNWSFEENNAGKKQAIYAFTGDVYRGFDVEQLSKEDVEYAQNHLRILSGLYGLLRPMDLMQPYRLEMGTKWQITKTNKNLYDYWGEKIGEQLSEDLQHAENKVLVNLASKEYYKAVKPKSVKGKIVNVHFKENKGGQYKIIVIYAKVARGRFARFMIQQRVEDIDSLKLFNEDGYAFHESLSSESDLVFTR